jgi:hypothetical protein
MVDEMVLVMIPDFDAAVRQITYAEYRHLMAKLSDLSFSI